MAVGDFGDVVDLFLYVANRGSNNVSAYTIDQSLSASRGAPTLVGTVAAGTRPASVAVDWSGRFLYVANTGDNNVSAYTINQSTGALTPIGGLPFSAGREPVAITTVEIEIL